jgi:hypothetical protein
MVEIPPLEELLLNFESFGDNCEFGLFQRQAGLEPLGLFRFAYTPLPSLLRGLACRFADMPSKITVSAAGNGEFMLKIEEYGFTYHTGRHVGEIEIEALRKDETTKMGFLIRRLTGTLASGEKIFVRKPQVKETLQDARTLLAAMQVYGPATLLFVSEADAAHPSGSVEMVGPHLIRGWVDRFAPYEDAHSINFTHWVDVCRGAYALWKSGFAVGSRLVAPVRASYASNLLLSGKAADEAGRRLVPQKRDVSTEVLAGSFPWRDPAADTICQHVLSDEKGFVGLRVDRLRPGSPYTCSLWVKLLDGPRLEKLGLFMQGGKFIRWRHVKLGQQGVWQRLEVTGIAPEDGILFPRLHMKGPSGTGLATKVSFITANWRFEEGLMVDAEERPTAVEPAAARRLTVNA